MPIRQIEIKKLPKGEAYIASLKTIKSHFKDELDVGLFMTNGKFEWDSACNARPTISGEVVAVASYSRYSESRIIRLLKLKSSQAPDFRFREAELILSHIKDWFIEIPNRKGILAHAPIVFTIDGQKINNYEVTWNQ